MGESAEPPIFEPVNFSNSPLATNETEAYNRAVSSYSSGGDNDSTGLRAERKLSTPLSRCESLAKPAQAARFRVDAATRKRGSRLAPPFFLFVENGVKSLQLLIRRVLVPPMMAPFAMRAVTFVVPPIVRRSCVRALRSRIRI